MLIQPQVQQPTTKASPARTFVRVVLGLFLIFAGVSHLTFAKKDFRAQVPDFVPLNIDSTVRLSGFAEIGLGMLLVFAGKRRRGVGRLTAWFFTLVFPGNLSQWVNRRDGFGLDTDEKRVGRLLLQPALIGISLWSTGPRRRR